MGVAIRRPKWVGAGSLPGRGRGQLQAQNPCLGSKTARKGCFHILDGVYLQDRRQVRGAAEVTEMAHPPLSVGWGHRGAGQASAGREEMGPELPLPGGGALFPSGAPTWPLLGQQVFLLGFFGVLRSGTRTGQGIFCPVHAF